MESAIQEYDNQMREEMDLALNAVRIQEALVSRGHVVECADFGPDLIATAQKAREFGAEIGFNLIECPLQCSDKEPHGAAFFELMNLPYTGNDPYAISVCKNKALTKCACAFGGIPTPAFKVCHAPLRSRVPLNYPVIVKPIEEDGSEGISENSVVETEAMLRRRVGEVFERFKRPVLVEEYIEGRELNMAVWGNGTAEDPYEVLPPAELLYHSKLWRVCSFESKWLADHPSYHEITARCPAEIPDELKRRLERLTLACARTFRLSGYARVDLRVDRKGRAFVLEVNPNPDLSPEVGFARNAAAAGFSFEQVVEEIVALGIARGTR